MCITNAHTYLKAYLGQASRCTLPQLTDLASAVLNKLQVCTAFCDQAEKFCDQGRESVPAGVMRSIRQGAISAVFGSENECEL